ncbi:hypothetical protein ACM66Z_09760 [Sulfurovum sp. ST-21]|uniref:Uncharacterized protein n=1 Tax=Sulfurovum indicum TaxID=2779528 RepID=A0A7M1S4P0_9BACT|nr:hypothetical protein [Sulfurovum indicum]QOR61699.1 hypothetical protein IMZ28_09745 [Sulfurovum indicum]
MTDHLAYKVHYHFFFSVCPQSLFAKYHHACTVKRHEYKEKFDFIFIDKEAAVCSYSYKLKYHKLVTNI